MLYCNLLYYIHKGAPASLVTMHWTQHASH